MDRENKIDRPASPSRRDALRRLAGAVVSAYVVPEVLFLSAARAGSSSPSAPSLPSAPSSPSGPPTSGPSDSGPTDSGPTDSGPSDSGPSDSGPSGNNGGASSASGVEDSARETCTIPAADGPNSISISRSDLSRSQDAVQAGTAKPLDQIWSEFISEYDGNVIGVEFLDRTRGARYRFKAISRSGRLETVTISAQTGIIERIVGC